MNNKGLAELDQAEIQYAQKLEEIKKLDEITGDVSQTDLKVSDLLQKVSYLMPASVVAETIIYNGASVTLSIKSKTRQDIALYLKKLHDDSNFVNVNISEISGRDKDFRCTIMLDISALNEVK
jgi:Tfp pilus assembly protein PilN